MRRYWIAIVALGLCQTSAAEHLTYVDLVNRLTDLERLAILPEPGEKCAQFSSYERKSRYDEATGKYVDWDANNHDGDSVVREENGKYVLAEMSGPGVIWRIWSARPEQGHVRIYLDGSDTPAVDLPFAGYFDRQHEPFTYAALVHQVASGQNNYVPIPYQASCKIVADKGWGEFYHFNYTTYPKGTVLPTFSMRLSAEDKAALAKVDTFLANCGTDPAGVRPGQAIEDVAQTVRPGDTARILQLAGSRAITAIRVTVDLPGSAQNKDNPAGLLRTQRDILRNLTLRITWDGEASPSVFAPLGDFFGTSPGVNKYKSLPLGMTDDGFYGHWYMPFAAGALVELSNNTQAARTVRFTIAHAPLTRPAANLGRFHARWHGDADLPADPQRRVIDWTLLHTRGQGRFVGVALHVWNPGGGWWGEGDEKFYIDGEKFPSTFGTGSEDYFGYAWCNPTEFQHAYHNQTRNGSNRGHISVNRWHITDNLPFQSSIEGAIEKFFPNERPTLYDCVAYWYQTEPHTPWEVESPFAGKAGKYLRLYRFFEDAQAYSASDAIEPLRATYDMLRGDPDLSGHTDKAILAMARVEKVAGNTERCNALLQPVIETLTIPFIDRDVTGEFWDMLPQPRTSEGQRVLLVSGLVTDREGDGSVKRVMKDGRWCIATECNRGKLYLYFALPADSKLRNSDRTVRMRITYHCDGDNIPSVQYDSFSSTSSEAYYHVADRIATPGARGWNTAVVSCPRARLSGHQNGEADFRIAAPDNHDIYIADVTVEQD